MTRVSQIMTADVTTLSPEMTLREALEVLWGRNVGGAPVVQGAKVVGIASTADLLEIEATSPPLPSFRAEQAEWGDVVEEEAWQEGASPPLYFVDLWREAEADAVERMATIGGPEWDFLADHTVAEIMSRKLLSVGPDDDVRLAARRMSEAGIHRLLVLDEGQLAGVVSASDIVHAVAHGRL
jgi:CBS domain-containing protein